MTAIRCFATIPLLLALAACATHAPRTSHVDAAAKPAGSDAAWALLDTNQDGVLSRDELEREHAVALLRDFGTADGNHDGRVSREEWSVWWPRITKTPPSPSMAALNASSAPTNGIRAQ